VARPLPRGPRGRCARRTIEEATRFDWLPVGLHVTLAEALEASFGPARAHEYYRRAIMQSVRGPVLGPLFQAGTRVLGLTPASFLRWAAHGWKVSFRDCGTVAGIVEGPGRGRLVYDGLPAVCRGSMPWIDSAQGTAYGVYDLTRVGGVVRMHKERLDLGHLELELEWIDR
jgi:hypothetical protein